MLPQIFKAAPSLTTDLIMLAVLFVLFALYTLYFGKNRIVAFILAFYPAAFFYEHFPFAAKLMVLSGPNLVVLNKVLIFLVFLVPLNIIISRYIFAESGYDGSSHYLRTAGFALAAVVLVLLFTYSIVSLDVFYNFSATIDKLFATGNMFWWSIAPLGLMLFL